MKMKIITMSILALLNGFSSSSHALPPSSYNSTAGDTLDLFIAGSSALDPALLKTLSKSFCTAGSMDVYSYNTQLVVLCTSSVALTGGKTKIALYKNSVGGSINGVLPVANGTPLTFISMAALKANPDLVLTTATVSSTTGLPAYTTMRSLPLQRKLPFPKLAFLMLSQHC
ncbi:hypothetical protein ACMYR3_03790 [Ampullimonas aquatilis]|uniref:hypothetical protein n=1 Tax=Ampullimonas aquatilis TaxID=1341549 RepID=UPI003C76CE92